ncbi:MAG: mechanosensitive ion channel family protein [Candidatus Fimenecus sp.]
MEKISEILNYSVGNFTVGKILAAVVVFVICYLILRVLMRLFTRLLSRVNMDDTLRKILLGTIKLILYFLVAMVVIDTLGVSVTSLLAAFSVVGLAASLAVQDSLSNLASGIMLLVTKPFKIGDYVEIDDVSGTVKMISLIHTRITTIDNKMIYVPNSKIIATKIVNYTQQEKRRVDLEISAAYDTPIETVRQSLLQAVAAVGLFVDTPAPPFAAVLSFDESSIRYVVRAWVKTEQYWDAYFALLEQIKAAFDENGVEMTYNHLNVHMVKE